MDLQHVNSTMIAAAGYDAVRQSLVILFNSGQAYEYQNVQPEVYQRFQEARSKGRFLNKEVIGQYPETLFGGWPAEAQAEVQQAARQAQVRIQYVTNEAGERVAAIVPLDLFYQIIDRL